MRTVQLPGIFCPRLFFFARPFVGPIARPFARYLLPLSVSVLLAAPARAAADAPADPAERERGGDAATIVVTAARSEQMLAEALPSVTVLTREDISRTQSRDLADLLSRQAGIEFARSGPPGGQASLFVRGANSNQVLVLVDGVRLNSALDGAANLGGVTTEAIEKVEIVRGNLSSLYGSEAIGGVVQIFTRASGEPGGDALAEAGQGHTRDLSARLTSVLAQTLLTVSAGLRSQQAVADINPSQVPGINPAAAANHNRSASLRWLDRGSEGEVSAWAWSSRNDTDWSDPFNASASIPSTQILQVEQAAQDAYGLSGLRRVGSSLLRGSVSETRDDSVNVSNVANTDPYSDADNSQFRSRNRLMALQDTTELFEDVDLTAGLEHLDQHGGFTVYDYLSGTTTLVGASRRADSVWMGTSGHRGGQQWQLNLRHDRYSDAGAAGTGLAGWGWELDPAWKLTAQYSTAMRAPSFNELYYPGYGNPSLHPERARSEELGLRWHRGSASASVAAYRSRTADLIVGLAPSYRSVNIARAAVDGSEWQLADTLGPLHLQASFTQDRPRDLGTGLPLLRRAHASAKLGASFNQGPWQAGAELQRSGPRPDLDILSGVRVQLPAYTLARASLARTLGRDLRLQLRIENLGNAHYQLVDGYNTLPRLVVAGVEAHW